MGEWRLAATLFLGVLLAVLLLKVWLSFETNTRAQNSKKVADRTIPLAGVLMLLLVALAGIALAVLFFTPPD